MSLLTRGLGEPGALVTRGLGSPGVATPLPGGAEGTVNVSVLEGVVDTELAVAVDAALQPVLDQITELTELVGTSNETPVLYAIANTVTAIDAQVTVEVVDSTLQVGTPLTGEPATSEAVDASQDTGTTLQGRTLSDDAGMIGEDDTSLGGG